MTGAERAVLDERIRQVLRDGLAQGFSEDELVFLLTRILPELSGYTNALGQLNAAYDNYRKRLIRG